MQLDAITVLFHHPVSPLLPFYSRDDMPELSIYKCYRIFAVEASVPITGRNSNHWDLILFFQLTASTSMLGDSS